MSEASTGSVFERLKPDQRKRVLAQQLQQFAEARQDPAVFITTCACAEHGAQQRVRLSAHQRLLLEFVQRHRSSVVRMPVGSSKTFLLMYLGLWMLGRDRTKRGVIVGANAHQSYKPLGYMRRQIESGRLRLVFPELRRSPDLHDGWAKDQLVVERPGNIRDPSFKAIGIDGVIQGARISWVLGDDMLSGENTHTKESRDAIERNFGANIFNRLDRYTGRCCITNTPWDRDDLTFRLAKRHWPLIAMNVVGDVWFENIGDPMQAFGNMIRPSRIQPGKYRLRGNDPDPEELKTIWPEEMTREWVETLQGKRKDPTGEMAPTPFDFARFYMCEPFDEGSARCQREWIDKAFELGLGMTFPAERTGNCPTFTGVDIGGIDKHHDKSAIFTFELHDDGRRKVLNMQVGNWTGAELISRIANEAKRYDSTVHVESNFAQTYVAEFAQKKDLSARIVRFDTNKKTKYDETFGVEAIFTELHNKLWIFPDGGRKDASDDLEDLGNDCVAYNPDKHTPDGLMAMFLARQGLARYRSRGARKGQAGKPTLQYVGGGM